MNDLAKIKLTVTIDIPGYGTANCEMEMMRALLFVADNPKDILIWALEVPVRGAVDKALYEMKLTPRRQR